MSYGNWEMQMEDEQASEDRMAISSGNMCRFCLSVVHVADSYDTCPRTQEQEADRLEKGDLDAYWKQQESKPDFTCTDCGKGFYYPHEGHYLDPHDEMVGRCVDCHVKNFEPCDSERCCA